MQRSFDYILKIIIIFYYLGLLSEQEVREIDLDVRTSGFINSTGFLEVSFEEGYLRDSVLTLSMFLLPWRIKVRVQIGPHFPHGLLKYYRQKRGD